MSSHAKGRRLKGLLTVGLFGTLTALMWPDAPWTAAIIGALTAYRLIELLRTWSGQQ